MSARRAITVVGMGDDGCHGLSSRAVEAVARAQVLVGGERHLAFFPQFAGERIVLKEGVGAAIVRAVELSAESNVCILASGDPLFFGIGGMVARKAGAEHVAFVPHPGAAQLAFARVGIPWEDATVLSLHGRTRAGFLTRLRSLSKAAVFTDGESTPARIATYLLEHGEEGFTAWVCESLDGPEERVRRFTLPELAAATDVGPLNTLVLVRSDPAWRRPAPVPFLHEDAFAKRMPKKGLITKREARLLSIALMQLRPDSVVWDVGAGSGSVSIEAAMLAREGRVYAVEVDPEGVAICRDNCRAFAVDNVTVIEGRAPEALEPLEPPDAVFVGGSKGSMESIIDAALKKLRPGGRLVVNAITLENSGEAYRCFRERGLVPEVLLLNVSRAEPLASYLRYEAQNPIQILAVTAVGS